MGRKEEEKGRNKHAASSCPVVPWVQAAFLALEKISFL